eukprot:CAMPEP_0114239302 /NCGR_PEP_ID=MMETSP0058-20121206/8387_1 /TAXON_ID=36894 /ORGANISM="Pyramimonas parkeae, CCMP726" /LENGTH=55 /DNA_ID=CAMNT_0001351473 /DNA_START=571 /DNA_END=734 /DNA_ORIENTATION=+
MHASSRHPRRASPKARSAGAAMRGGMSDLKGGSTVCEALQALVRCTELKHLLRVS